MFKKVLGPVVDVVSVSLVVFVELFVPGVQGYDLFVLPNNIPGRLV